MKQRDYIIATLLVLCIISIPIGQRIIIQNTPAVTKEAVTKELEVKIEQYKKEFLLRALEEIKPKEPNLPLNSVVQIKVQDNEAMSYYDDGGRQGSGVFISDNLILTAGHIVDGAVDIEIIKLDGTICKAVDWYLETDADIGFIKVETKAKEKKLNFDDAILGEDVWAYGNPWGVFPVLSKGIISAVKMPDDFMQTKNMIIVDAAINPGNSGCPIWDKDGNILGICSWGYENSQGMSYFVRSEIIKLSLEKYKAIKTLEKIE